MAQATAENAMNREIKFRAWDAKAKAIEASKAVLENRKKFEADQSELARVKAEQEAEKKRLEEEMVKIEAERKAQEEATMKEQEFIRAEREKLEKEKAEVTHAAIITERESVWDIAKLDNFNFDHTAALADHEEFKASLQAEIDQARADAVARWEQTEAAKKATAERLKLIGPDKLMMATIADDFDKWVSSMVDPELGTKEAMLAYCDLISRFKSSIHCFDQAGKGLK